MKRNGVAVSGVHLDIYSSWKCSECQVMLCMVPDRNLRHIMKNEYPLQQHKITVIIILIHHIKTSEKYYVS